MLHDITNSFKFFLLMIDFSSFCYYAETNLYTTDPVPKIFIHVSTSFQRTPQNSPSLCPCISLHPHPADSAPSSCMRHYTPPVQNTFLSFTPFWIHNVQAHSSSWPQPYPWCQISHFDSLPCSSAQLTVLMARQVSTAPSHIPGKVYDLALLSHI